MFQFVGDPQDHRVQPLAPHRSALKSKRTTECIVKVLLEIWWLSAVTTVLGILCHAHHPLVENLFLIPPLSSPLMQLHAVPLGPFAVTRVQSSALFLCSL